MIASLCLTWVDTGVSKIKLREYVHNNILLAVMDLLQNSGSLDSTFEIR